VDSFVLYGGKVTLQYDDAKHKYVAVEEDGRIIPATSVTTVLSVVNKPALIQWAVNQAIDHLRSRLYDGGEFDVDDLERFLDEAKYAHKFVKQEAADIGNGAHHWLEDYWLQKMKAAESGEDFAVPPLPEHPQVRNCVEAAIKWIEEHDIKPLIIEKPLYSRVHQVAGRMDKLALVDGRLAVVDWKSSTGLWPEYILQTAAYASIYMEEFPEKQIQDRWLIKLGKYDGEFHAERFGRADLERDYEAFVAAAKLYKRMQELNRKR
jgi:hypothetical protein